jgi:hypothetical protein
VQRVLQLMDRFNANFALFIRFHEHDIGMIAASGHPAGMA